MFSKLKIQIVIALKNNAVSCFCIIFTNTCVFIYVCIHLYVCITITKKNFVNVILVCSEGMPGTTKC